MMVGYSADDCKVVMLAHYKTPNPGCVENIGLSGKVQTTYFIYTQPFFPQSFH